MSWLKREKNKSDVSLWVIHTIVIASILTMKSQLSIALLLVALVVLFFKFNKTNYWLAMLFSGVFTFGYISMFYHIPHLGKMVGILSIIGLMCTKDLQFFYKAPIAYGLVGWTLSIIALSFVFVPATELGIEKYSEILYNCLIFICVTWVLVKSIKINLAQVGYMVAVLALLYISAAAYFEMSGSFNLSEFGNLRNILMSSTRTERSLLNYQTVGNDACLAIVFIVLYIIKKNKQYDLSLLLMTALSSVILLYISGSRQSYVICIAIFATVLLLYRKKLTLKIGVILLFVLTIIAIALTVAYLYKVDFIVSVIEGDMNRSSNYETALDIIKDNFLWGVGLGNYYVPFFYHLDVNHIQYAHNLFLELLTELGFVLTAFLLIPWLIVIVRYFKKIIFFKSKSEMWVLPIVVVFFLRAMISSDLTESIRLFVLLAFIVNEISSCKRTTIRNERIQL